MTDIDSRISREAFYICKWEACTRAARRSLTGIRIQRDLAYALREGKRQVVMIVINVSRQRKVRTVKNKVQRSLAVLPLEACRIKDADRSIHDRDVKTIYNDLSY